MVTRVLASQSVEIGERRGGIAPRLLGLLLAPFRLVSRVRGRWRLLLIGLECLIAASVGMFAWRMRSLAWIPDVGPPAGVSAKEVAEAVAPEDDALPLYLEALKRLGPLPAISSTSSRRPGFRPIARNDPRLGPWLEASRESLDLYRRASMRPDMAQGTESRRESRWFDIQLLSWLVVEQGIVAEESGDLEGAWKSYLSALRTGRLIARRGSLADRQLAHTIRSYVLTSLPRWTRHKANTPALLRKALSDVQTLEMIQPNDLITLRETYRNVSARLALGDGPFRGSSDGGGVIAGIAIPGEVGLRILRFSRWLHREPERSRRVLNLAFANWLAWAEIPQTQRPKAAAAALIGPGAALQRVDFYAFHENDGVPASARALAPLDLARAYADANEASALTAWSWNFIGGNVRRERRDQASLLITIAEGLYEKERGSPPPSTDALVGPYLPSLPDDGTNSTFDDADIPRVEATSKRWGQR